MKDWKTHKPSCPPFSVRETPGRGRGLFATRRIKEGEIILDEYPLCTLSLGSMTIFSLYEFKTKHFPNIDKETKATILKFNDPADIFETLDTETVEEIISKIPCLLLWKEFITDETNKFLRIFIRNRTLICGDSSLYSNTTEAGLYRNISLINHCCLPNAVDSWVMGDCRRHQVRALRTIEKEEEIVVSYCQNWPEFNWGSREFRQQQLLETRVLVCQCSECSLEGEELQENQRMRAEVREKKAEIRQTLSGGGSDRRRSVKKAMKLAQQRVNLVQKLNIRVMFVSEMINFYDAASDAKKMGISAPDPDTFKHEALKYAKKYGDALMYCCSKYFQ